jgi:opacity protein-like surface antigen
MRRLACGMFAALALAVFATPGNAESEMGFKGVGPVFSYVWPENLDGTGGFGLNADFGNLTRTIGIEAAVDYWSRTEGSGAAEVKIRDLALGVRAMVEFDVQDSKLRPSAGAGLSIHMLKSEVPEQTVGTVTFGGESSKTRVGLDLVGGARYQLVGNVDLTGQIMYRIVEDLGQFALGIGLMFGFGR